MDEVDSGHSATGPISEDHVVAYIDEPVDLAQLAERVLAVIEAPDAGIKTPWRP